MNTNKTSDEAKQRAANYMSLKGALESKQETLEEAAEKFVANTRLKNSISLFCEGAKWQQERMYIEEEVIQLLNNCRGENPIDIKKWFEQYKKK